MFLSFLVPSAPLTCYVPLSACLRVCVTTVAVNAGRISKPCVWGRSEPVWQLLSPAAISKLLLREISWETLQGSSTWETYGRTQPNGFGNVILCVRKPRWHALIPHIILQHRSLDTRRKSLVATQRRRCTIWATERIIKWKINWNQINILWLPSAYKETCDLHSAQLCGIASVKHCALIDSRVKSKKKKK
jgi:hypothetical protein